MSVPEADDAHQASGREQGGAAPMGDDGNRDGFLVQAEERLSFRRGFSVVGKAHAIVDSISCVESAIARCFVGWIA